MVKAIETQYNGYRFRSRLEARYAVLLDTLGIRFEYEKEGYDLGNGVYYLPDFWLPEQECWVEIKGNTPNTDEDQKAHLLAKQAGLPVFIHFGEIQIPSAFQKSAGRHIGRLGGNPIFEAMIVTLSKLGVSLYLDGEILKWDMPEGLTHAGEIERGIKDFTAHLSFCLGEGLTGTWDGHHSECFWLTECTYCGHINFTWFGDMRLLPCGCLFQVWPMVLGTPAIPNYASPRLINAYTSARQARFEFQP